MMRSRSRIASQLYAVSFPVSKWWFSSTMGPHLHLDDVRDLEGPEERRVGLDLEVGLLDRGAAVRAVELVGDGPGDAVQGQLAAAIGDRLPLEDLLVDR